MCKKYVIFSYLKWFLKYDLRWLTTFFLFLCKNKFLIIFFQLMKYIKKKSKKPNWIILKWLKSIVHFTVALNSLSIEVVVRVFSIFFYSFVRCSCFAFLISLSASVFLSFQTDFLCIAWNCGAFNFQLLIRTTFSSWCYAIALCVHTYEKEQKHETQRRHICITAKANTNRYYIRIRLD